MTDHLTLLRELRAASHGTSTDWTRRYEPALDAAIAAMDPSRERALDKLFRARWELSDGSSLEDDNGCIDISNLDPELDALAKASGFDRSAAVQRWVLEQEREAAAAHARYQEEIARGVNHSEEAMRGVGDAIALFVNSLNLSQELSKLNEQPAPPPPKKSLVGQLVSALWEKTKREKSK